MSDDFEGPRRVIVNEHGRRYPRTLQQAFPQSEGYRCAIHLPPPRWVKTDRVAWLVVIGLCAWLLWFVATHRPQPFA